MDWTPEFGYGNGDLKRKATPRPAAGMSILFLFSEVFHPKRTTFFCFCQDLVVTLAWYIFLNDIYNLLKLFLICDKTLIFELVCCVECKRQGLLLLFHE